MSNIKHDPLAVVSSESEPLILVNSKDEPIGFADKSTSHDGEGMLHRAFSILIFNTRGELLLQQRAPGKRLWGNFWSNSCCSHPRKGETMEQATQRRLWEELGLEASLSFLYKFEYHCQFGSSGAEHELCWVFVGVSDNEPSTNTNEIAQWRYINQADLDHELTTTPEVYTPWFKMEWERIKTDFRQYLEPQISHSKQK